MSSLVPDYVHKISLDPQAWSFASMSSPFQSLATVLVIQLIHLPHHVLSRIPPSHHFQQSEYNPCQEFEAHGTSNRYHLAYNKTSASGNCERHRVGFRRPACLARVCFPLRNYTCMHETSLAGYYASPFWEISRFRACDIARKRPNGILNLSLNIVDDTCLII